MDARIEHEEAERVTADRGEPETAEPVTGESAPGKSAPGKSVTGKSATVDRPADQVGTLHRAITSIALFALFSGALGDWLATIWVHRNAGLMVMAGYGLVLLFAVLAFTVRTSKAMLLVDVGVVISTLVIRIPAFLTSFPSGAATYANDEGRLTAFGGGLLRHGTNPYVGIWPTASIGGTKTMAGGVVDHYDYPPVPAILTALHGPKTLGIPTASLIASIALLAAVILMFVLLPTPWRALAPLICVAIPLLPKLAHQAYPEIIALPFLIVAVNRWTRLGSTGRLRLAGTMSAIGLGIGISTQQMAWFLAPFLVLGVLMVRLGDLPRRTAIAVTLRYVGVTALTAAVFNAPFAVWDFHAWLTAMLTPVTSATVPHGQGLIDISYYFTGGSAALQLYSTAALLFAVALLALFVLMFRRLGPAMAILPWPIFYLSIRSSDKYFYVFAPLWIVSLLTVSRRDFATAPELFDTLSRWRPRQWRRFQWRPFQWRPIRAVVAAILILPAVVCVGVAALTPQPLRMTVDGMTVTASGNLVRVIDVTIENATDTTIRPHFALSSSDSMSWWWAIQSGPASLAPHQRAEFVLTPMMQSSRRDITKRVFLRAVSDKPVTLSSVQIGPDAKHPIPITPG